MEEKKLTDEEIITALKKQPKYDTVLYLEKAINATDILDLIHRLQAEKDKNYNNGFDKGVKAAVEKMRAYLPPRDVDDYPDDIPSHWQLDEVLRQLIDE